MNASTAAPQKACNVDVRDIDLPVAGGSPLHARVFQPHGNGPFPAVVDAHGGAWIQGTCVNNDPVNRPVSGAGIVVMSVDYRLPPDATYPGSVADINYAVRWLKTNATRFNTSPEQVGVMGTSSGGHLAVLAALKPDEPRFAAIRLPGSTHDAHVPYVVAMWPVICPYGRFQVLKQRWEKGEDHHPGRVGGGADQMKYWLTEEAMADGSPTLALERGDKVELPGILYVQAYADTLHPRENLDHFGAGYRKAGGHLEFEFVEGEPYDLVRSVPDSPAARKAIARITSFIRRHAAPPA